MAENLLAGWGQSGCKWVGAFLLLSYVPHFIPPSFLKKIPLLESQMISAIELLILFPSWQLHFSFLCICRHESNLWKPFEQDFWSVCQFACGARRWAAHHFRGAPVQCPNCCLKIAAPVPLKPLHCWSFVLPTWLFFERPPVPRGSLQDEKLAYMPSGTAQVGGGSFKDRTS